MLEISYADEALIALATWNKQYKINSTKSSTEIMN
jgi:hypothetical protein